MTTEATLNTIRSLVPSSTQQKATKEKRAHKTEIQRFCYILNSLPAAGSNKSNTDLADGRVAMQEDIIVPRRVQLQTNGTLAKSLNSGGTSESNDRCIGTSVPWQVC